MSETGHALNIQHFEEMIARVTGYGGAYNPSNGSITLVKLQVKLASSNAAMDQVSIKDAAEDAAKTARENTFKPLGPLVTRAVNYYASTGAADNKVADAKGFKRKIDGKRATPAIKDDPATPEDESKQSISASQQSYTQKVEHFESLIDLFKGDAAYNPNEIPIKTAQLTTLSTALKASNTAVYTAETGGDNARLTRNNELYNATNGLCELAGLVKNYVKALYGASSPEYKQISGLSFRREKV